MIVLKCEKEGEDAGAVVARDPSGVDLDEDLAFARCGGPRTCGCKKLQCYALARHVRAHAATPAGHQCQDAISLEVQQCMLTQSSVVCACSCACPFACPPPQALSDMGLLHVRDVIVGTPLVKGISGGERKRLCVALELITQPALLFL